MRAEKAVPFFPEIVVLKEWRKSSNILKVILKELIHKPALQEYVPMQ